MFLFGPRENRTASGSEFGSLRRIYRSMPGGSSVDQFQRELEHPRLIRLTADHGETWRTETLIRRSKPRRVRQIERLRPELQPQLFVQGGVLHQREIHLAGAVVTQPVEGSRRIPERVRRRCAELRSVEPAVRGGIG